MIKNEIACVIISYNIGEKILKCYDSIKNQVDKVIIVDNGSDEETVEVLKRISSIDNVYIIFNRKNYGIAKALNQGIRKAIDLKYKWVITMDNDSESTIGMVDSMINTYNSIKNSEKENIVSIAVNYLDRSYEDTNEVLFSKEGVSEYSYEELVITSGNIIKLDIFEKIGFFKEEYFIDYVDYEFCLRLRENNKKIIKVNNALLKHKIGDGISKNILFKKIKSSNHSAIRRYYITRNSLDLYYKYSQVNCIKDTKAMLIRMAIKIILLENQKIEKIKYMLNGYIDFKRKKFGKMSIPKTKA